MKKLIMTIAIVLGLGLTSFADPNGGGLFYRGATAEENGNRTTGNTPIMPNHGLTENQNADTPLGGGVAVLLSLGAAYAIGKKRKEE